MVVDNLSFLKTQEERIAYRSIWEKAERADTTFTFVATDFLDPFLQALADSVRNSFPNLRLSFLGGYPEAERKRAVFYPDFLELEDEREFISVLAFDNKEFSIGHRDVLGKTLSLGLDRKVIGDILIDDKVILIVSASVSNFLLSELRDIKRHKIQLYEYTENLQISEDEQWIAEDIITPALRIDTVIAKLFRLSRSDAQRVIRQGKLKINHREETKTHATIQEGDLISLRGYGRVRCIEQAGKTQRGNFRLIFKKQMEKR
ncbi:MAG: YlmH/Sll1252 family protein [Tissierellia bacterium]|nr:YlmH/Sll1252 family protein [Tissierellia bacterium]